MADERADRIGAIRQHLQACFAQLTPDLIGIIGSMLFSDNIEKAIGLAGITSTEMTEALAGLDIGFFVATVRDEDDYSDTPYVWVGTRRDPATPLQLPPDDVYIIRHPNGMDIRAVDAGILVYTRHSHVIGHMVRNNIGDCNIEPWKWAELVHALKDKNKKAVIDFDQDDMSNLTVIPFV